MARRYAECNVCETNNFNTYRYRCLICPEFDLCGFCFERHLKFDDHKLSHLMFKFNTVKICSDIKINDTNDDLDLDILEEKFENYKHKETCKTCKKVIVGLKLKCDICYFYYQCYGCYLRKRISDEHIYDKHPMIVSNDKVIDLDKSELKILDELGRGGFGVVNKAEYKYDNESIYIAVKKMQPNSGKKLKTEEAEALLKSFLRELDAYNEIKGENILQMIGNCISNNDWYIATEYMQNGSLTKMLKNFGLLERFKVAFGIICGIKRIHANGYVHKDIKPDNVLITNDYCAKIADFGLAKIIMDKETKFTCSATYAYMPPEFFDFLSGKLKPNLDDLQRIDIFSLGLTLVEIFKGTHGKRDGSTGPIVVKLNPEYLQELLNKCVCLEASKRPTIYQIFDYLIVLNDFIQFLRTVVVL